MWKMFVLGLINLIAQLAAIGALIYFIFWSYKHFFGA